MATYRIECRVCWEVSYVTIRPSSPLSWDHLDPSPGLHACPCCGNLGQLRAARHTGRPYNYYEHVRVLWHLDRQPLSREAWKRVVRELAQNSPR